MTSDVLDYMKSQGGRFQIQKLEKDLYLFTYDEIYNYKLHFEDGDLMYVESILDDVGSNIRRFENELRIYDMFTD